MSSKIVSEIFSSFEGYLTNEQDVRDEIRVIVKNMEKASREIITVLQIIHHEYVDKDLHAAISEARRLFEDVGARYKVLAAIIPQKEYYRYHDHWRFVTQRLCFSAALVVFLEDGVLIAKEKTAEILGIKDKPEDGFHLDLEDYLMGILQLSSELARFAVNAVTYGDYRKPLQISKFVAELNAGFRLLSLKNDSLRKRFDALKYDVKKIEEVVYDLSIRGLTPKKDDDGESQNATVE